MWSISALVAGAALPEEREDQLLLAVVVCVEEGQDVLVVVGDQRHTFGITGLQCPRPAWVRHRGCPGRRRARRTCRWCRGVVQLSGSDMVPPGSSAHTAWPGYATPSCNTDSQAHATCRNSGAGQAAVGSSGDLCRPRPGRCPGTGPGPGPRARSTDSETPDPVPPELDLSRVPVHVACVMDGNGRWANARGLPRTEGHGAGETALLDVVNGALEIGIKWITLYAFSTENWRRPPDEVRYLMNFNQSLLMRRRDELNEKGVQIRFAGRRDWRVPRRVLKRMDESIELTKHNRRMVMTMAFNYGGRAEIVDAVRALVAEGTPGQQDRREGDPPPPLLPRHARPRPGDPHLGRDADLELLAVGDRLQRAGLPRDALARHAPPPPLRGGHRLPAPGAPLRGRQP